MTSNPPHRLNINLILPIGPNANHRLRTTPEEKPPPAMLPAEALAWMDDLQKNGKEITAIELCGPGDVVSSWSTTRLCLELLHDAGESAKISLTTLGLGMAERVSDLVELGVSRVTLLVDTVNPETAAKLYTWIRPGKKTVPLSQAVEILLHDQSEAVKFLAAAGITVTIRTAIQEGINKEEIPALAEKMADLGASSLEISGEVEDLEKLVSQASANLETKIFQPQPELPPPGVPQSCESVTMPAPTKERPYVAVASAGGMEVDLHLGQAGQLLIYGPRDDGLACLIETRPTPPSGSPDRWQSLANGLTDCFALLVTHAGEAPRQQLAENGIKVILIEDQIEGVVDVLFGGGKKGKCKK